MDVGSPTTYRSSLDKVIMALSNNNGKHLVSIIDRVKCIKHAAPEGVPCYHLPKADSDGFYAGVCGLRVNRAGYNGKISALSLQLKTPGGRGGNRKR